MWYELISWRQSDSKEITADIRVPPHSPWFCGHFPGEPILPGIAQLGMVFDAIKQAGDCSIKISTISRVRFKQIIKPDDHLTIVATPRNDPGKSYTFRIMVAKELVCSGIMTVENRSGQEVTRR